MRALTFFTLIFFTSFCFAQDPNYNGLVKILLYPDCGELNTSDEEQLLARGSGFIVSPQGLVLTNTDLLTMAIDGYMIANVRDDHNHLHENWITPYKRGAEKNPNICQIKQIGHAIPIVQVFHQSGNTLYRAEIITAGDSFKGALLKIVANMDGSPVAGTFPFIPMGNSDHLLPNEHVTLLGFPLKVTSTGTELRQQPDTGVSQNIGVKKKANFCIFQLDAELNPGFKGGPALDTHGRAVGIIDTPSTLYPINLVAPMIRENCLVYQELRKYGLWDTTGDLLIRTIPPPLYRQMFR